MIRPDEDELQRMEDEGMESILFAANMENGVKRDEVNINDFLKYVPYSYDKNWVPTRDSQKNKDARDLWVRFIENSFNGEEKRRIINRLKALDEEMAFKNWNRDLRDKNLEAVEKLGRVVKSYTSLEPLIRSPLYQWWLDKNIAFNMQSYNSIIEYLDEISYIIITNRYNKDVLEAVYKYQFLSTFKYLNSKWDKRWKGVMKEIISEIERKK